MDGYNILIHIKPLLNPRRYQEVDLTNKNQYRIELPKFEENENVKIPVVGFNPVAIYVQELRVSFLKLVGIQ